MAEVQIDPKRVEQLGPADRAVTALSTFTDHLVHNRPGFVVKDARTNIGVRWVQATWRKQEDGSKVVFTCTKVGKKTTEVRVGVLGEDGKSVVEGGKVVGEYREPGLFPEVALYLYRTVAEVFRLDNEFAARWASYAFDQDRRDLKSVLAAFMLVQNRKGIPHIEDGEVIFVDDDYRAVGEAMLLIRKKGADLNPKQILLVGEILRLPEIHALNRELGFAQSAKNPQMRRYEKAVHKWLGYREANPKMLEGLVKAGFTSQVRELAKSTKYKPVSENFFRVLRWKQKQSPDGRRDIGLNLTFEAKPTWEGLSEAEICQKIVSEKPGWMVLVGQLPEGIGLTRAIVAAAVEAKVLAGRTLIMFVPTLEDLGMLSVEPVASALKAAVEGADDQRSRNIARNVKSKEATDILEAASDKATEKAIEKVMADMRCYFVVDKSGSMEGALEIAKDLLSKFLGGFPLDRTHVSVFNSEGSEIRIQTPKAAAVAHAFSGHTAGGSTVYGKGIEVLQKHRPLPGETVLCIFVGDEAGETGSTFARTVRASGLNPAAFGILPVVSKGYGRGNTVRAAAADLQIPCFEIDPAIFNDPYAVTQTLTNLIASTPVGATLPGAVAPKRVSLVETILRTPLLEIPAAFVA